MQWGERDANCNFNIGTVHYSYWFLVPSYILDQRLTFLVLVGMEMT